MRARAADLPVADVAGEVMVLDCAAVVRGVRAADVELRAVVRELERENVLLRGALRDCGREERVLLHAVSSTVGVRWISL